MKCVTGLTYPHTNFRLKHIARPSWFYLAAWNVDGGEVVVDGLKIDLPINPFEWPMRKAKIRPASFVSCKVSWPPVPPAESWGTPSVTLLKWLIAEPNPELLAHQDLMLNPLTKIKFPFCTMMRDTNSDQFEGSADWAGQPIKISINGEFGGDVEGQAQVLGAILADQRRWTDYMVEIIEREYPDWRDSWARDAEAEMTCDSFVASFRLESIEIISPDMLSFWLDDGGLYGEHSIELEGNPETGFNDFAIRG